MRGATKTPALILGTAQLGMAYGAANHRGMLSDVQGREVLEAAWNAGVRWFDTARAYGESERRLGAFLRSLSPAERREARVATKLAPGAGLAPGECLRSLESSLEALGTGGVAVLFVHRGEEWTPTLARDLEEWRRGGVVERVGVSLYDEGEYHALVRSTPRPDLLQVPSNLLDRRFSLRELERRGEESPPPVPLWGRSLFLQGLLAQGDREPWQRVGGDVLRREEFRRALASLAEDVRMSLKELALLAVGTLFCLEGVVVGAEDPRQIGEWGALWSAAGARNAPEDLEERLEILGRIMPPGLADPRRWPLAEDVAPAETEKT